MARLLEPAALLDSLADAFVAAARGEVIAPPRSALELDARRGLLVMPGRRAGGPVIVKHVGLYADNPAHGLPPIRPRSARSTPTRAPCSPCSTRPG